jgi:hypothetical protein
MRDAMMRVDAVQRKSGGRANYKSEQREQSCRPNHEVACPSGHNP